MPKKTAIPVNYREHLIKVQEQDILIGGMASPDKSLYPDSAIAYIAEKAAPLKALMIGLKEQDFTELVSRHGVEYIHFPFEDWHIAPPERYDQLFQYVQQAIAEHRPITIHCGAGNGRTGTAIASLKLREIIEREAKINPGILDEPQQLIAEVVPSMRDKTACTEYVREAVESIRTNRRTPENAFSSVDNGLASVETVEDIQALLNYECFIKEKLKQGLLNDLNKRFSNLTPQQCIALCKEIPDMLAQKLQSIEDFIHLLQTQNSEQIKAIGEGMQTLWPTFFQSLHDIKFAMLQLNHEQFNALFDIIIPRLPEIITISEDLSEIFMLFKSSKGPDIYEVMKPMIPAIIFDDTDFINVISHLQPAQCTELCMIMGSEILNIIPSIHKLTSILSFLDDEHFAALCHGIPHELPFIIKTVNEFATIMSEQSPQHRTIIYEVMKENLPDIIHDPNDLEKALMPLTPNQCTELCVGMHKKLFNLTKIHHIYQHLHPKQIDGIFKAEIIVMLTQFFSHIVQNNQNIDDYQKASNLVLINLLSYVQSNASSFNIFESVHALKNDILSQLTHADKKQDILTIKASDESKNLPKPFKK